MSGSTFQPLEGQEVLSRRSGARRGRIEWSANGRQRIFDLVRLTQSDNLAILSHGVSLLVRFWQARHPPRYAAFLKPSSPRFPHNSRVDDDLLNRKAGWEQGQQRIGHGEEGFL
jgi:hypothetical protein